MAEETVEELEKKEGEPVAEGESDSNEEKEEEKKEEKEEEDAQLRLTRRAKKVSVAFFAPSLRDDDEDAMMVVKIGETARIVNVTNASFHVLFGFFFAFSELR